MSLYVDFAMRAACILEENYIILFVDVSLRVASIFKNLVFCIFSIAFWDEACVRRLDLDISTPKKEY